MNGSWTDPATERIPARGRGLVLIGYRGTGKSTIGRLVARRTGRRFLDSDREIERRAGKSIASIFADQGEPAFRDLEAAVVDDLSEVHDLILATGGGAILRETNRRALSRLGFVVWLVARPETLANRLLRDEKQIRMRPSLTAAGTLAEISDVLAARIPLYEAAADLEVDTENRSVAAIADHVTRVWLDWRAAHPTPSEAGGSPR